MGKYRCNSVLFGHILSGEGLVGLLAGGCLPPELHQCVVEDVSALCALNLFEVFDQLHFALGELLPIALFLLEEVVVRLPDDLLLRLAIYLLVQIFKVKIVHLLVYAPLRVAPALLFDELCLLS